MRRVRSPGRNGGFDAPRDQVNRRADSGKFGTVCLRGCDDAVRAASQPSMEPSVEITSPSQARQIDRADVGVGDRRPPDIPETPHQQEKRVRERRNRTDDMDCVVLGQPSREARPLQREAAQPDLAPRPARNICRGQDVHLVTIRTQTVGYAIDEPSDAGHHRRSLRSKQEYAHGGHLMVQRVPFPCRDAERL